MAVFNTPLSSLVIFLFLFTICAQAGDKGVAKDSSTLSAAIAYLETNPLPELQIYNGEHLESDLLRTYSQEMQVLAAEWATRQPKTNSPNKDELRQLENQFFHGRVVQQNEKLVESLRKSGISKKPPRNLKPMAEKAFSAIRLTALGDPSQNYQYDPRGEIGFCFGRAFFAHYELLKAGVPAHALAKIFVVGDLFVEKIMWRFHVAVVLQDQENGFLVVDPMQNKVMTLSEWMEITKLYGVKRSMSRVRFYFTDPRKFLPGAGTYDDADFLRPEYGGYFERLAETLGEVGTGS